MIQSDDSEKLEEKNQEFDKSNINYASDEESSSNGVKISKFKDQDDSSKVSCLKKVVC